MKEISMAMDKESSNGHSLNCGCCQPTVCSHDGPRYPWGLSINLEGDQLDALGIKKLPKVGSTTTMTANIKITSCNERDDQESGPSRSITIQITDLGIDLDFEEAEALKKAYKAHR